MRRIGSKLVIPSPLFSEECLSCAHRYHQFEPVTPNSKTKEAFILDSLIRLLLGRILDMSSPTNSDGEAVASTSNPENPFLDPVVNPIDDLVLFDIDSVDLPKGYFLSPFFIGMMTASGLAVAAVSI